MAIKHVCERCGDISNGHKVYFGRYVAIDTPKSIGTWYRKKKTLYPNCLPEIEEWIDNKKCFN